eukprot:4750322-Pleurochrysis_carterae.AAC.2
MPAGITTLASPFAVELTVPCSHCCDSQVFAVHRHAVFYHEIIERVSQRASKSWYIHGFMVKVPRVQLAIGEESSVGISTLELQNAETKRTATKNATKH